MFKKNCREALAIGNFGCKLLKQLILLASTTHIISIELPNKPNRLIPIHLLTICNCLIGGSWIVDREIQGLKKTMRY